MAIAPCECRKTALRGVENCFEVKVKNLIKIPIVYKGFKDE